MKLLPSYLRAGRAPERSLASTPSGSDSLGRGMDVALTLLVFLGIGWAIDAWLGIFPVVTIGLVVFSAVGTFIRLKYTYDATMERLEAERLAGRPGRATTGASPGSIDAGTMEGRDVSAKPAIVTQLDGEPVEIQVTTDMVKHGLLVAPALIGAAGLVWGVPGAWSAAYAIALVLLNFALSAVLISYTAKISLGLMMGATLFGYLVRLGLIMLAVLLVKDAGWISLPALGATIIVTHLGLLVWELKYVAITLAHPGLKPARP